MGSLIISRALLLALTSACVSALTPLTAADDDSDCALYLNGPGRSSAYDYTLNLLKGNFAYEGQHTCITYDAVNQAYLEARNRIVVSQPKGEWKAEDFASVGELILDISINLARRYGLTYEEIEKGLPLIDTSRTLIRDVCPPVFSHVECRAGKYRRLDGLCNNLDHPTWGSTMSPFQRLIGPLFADGINAPRIAHTGRDLPLSRVVSKTMHPDEGYHDHAGTVMVIAWGQFMDHDYTLTGTPLDPINRNDPEECCARPQHLKHPYCNEIRIPDDDYFYRLWGVKCIDFVRAFPSPRPGCRLGSRVPFNTLTGAIDGNTVYGVTDKFSRKLRTGYGGLLRMNPVFKEYGLKDLLPLKLDIPDEGCTRPNKNMYCFEGGEIRVNEQLVLTVMHTLMAREHNRIAKALAAVNPHWDDETLFQEARRINVAEIQHITYNEFLPILLGKDVMEKFGLVLEKEGYWEGYDPSVNPDVIDAFASAAFRFGHSLLPTAVERWSKAHKFIASKRLSDLIRRPYDLYRAGVLDEYVMGLMNQVAQAMDDSITQEVTNHLFKKIGARFGMDLVSFNMQRGREFGIPGYMEYRKFCGLNGANTFQDLFGSMPNETVRKYETIFEHPVDVDLWSGGVSERPLPGSMLGPTFACVIATQFSYSRRGDRFWFELPNQPSSFTPEQLVEVRKARLARVICDNTDIIDTVQLYPMVLPDHELNPRVPCRSGIIPSMDFSKWAEPAPFPAGSKPFITEAYATSKNQTTNETQSIEAEKQSNVNWKNTDVELFNSTVEYNEPNEHNLQAEIKEVTDCKNKTALNCSSNGTHCTECEPKYNETQTDTLLKYVYKTDDKIEVQVKPTGHPKNSLRRRRRRSMPKIDVEPAASAPLIVNYETSHEPQPFVRPTPNVIRGAALADFNIHTVHDSNPKKHDEVQDRSNTSEDSQSKSIESDMSNERVNKADSSNSDESDTNERNHKSSEDNTSTEKKPYKESDSGERNVESDEIRYHVGESKNKEPYKENHSIEYNGRSKETSLESEESREDKKTNLFRRKHHSGERSDSQEISPDEMHEDVRNNRPYKRQHSAESKDSRERPADEGSYENREDRPHQNSREKYNFRNKERDSLENVDSREKYHPRPRYTKAPHSVLSEDSNEGGEVSDDFIPQQKKRDKNKSDYTSRDDASESNEKVESQEKKNLPPSKGQHLMARRSHPEGLKKYVKPTVLPKPSESAEQQAAITILKRKNFSKTKDEHKSKSAPLAIKDVDLSDFTYERIHVNDDGVVEPLKDIPDNHNKGYDVQSDVAEDRNEQLSRHRNDVEVPFSSESEESNRSAPIDDLEVKPVVEINPELQEQEENSKEALKTNPNEDMSLESLLGIKKFKENSEEKSDNIITPQEEENNSDVKQQFERIPLNYNHDKNQNAQSKKQSNNEQPKSVPESSSKDDTKDLGTIDVLKPLLPNSHYDEHLNYKFDDISIKLPVIKLPDDILAIPYIYEETPYKKENRNKDKDPKKEKFFQYNEHEYNKEEDPHDNDDDEHKNNYNHEIHADHDDHKDIYDHDDNLDHGYLNYHGKDNKKEHENHHDHDYQKYYEKDKKKENLKKRKPHQYDDENDDEEDLYEKFVRERFGKSGSFEKRSEKLQDTRPALENQRLFESVHQVLKKAGNIEKEAQKSGDPNAGYMWTLEYGQKL